VIDAGRDNRLDHLVIRDNTDGSTNKAPADALFIFIGARPHTEWLGRTLAVDRNGFLLTGRDLVQRESSGWPLARPPTWLETSMPGVLTAGDIRHGSTKRVAAAVGEGSTAAMLVGCYRSNQASEAVGPASKPRLRSTRDRTPLAGRPMSLADGRRHSSVRCAELKEGC
jgi:thioredoxin reductase (NADPH)